MSVLEISTKNPFYELCVRAQAFVADRLASQHKQETALGLRQPGHRLSGALAANLMKPNIANN